MPRLPHYQQSSLPVPSLAFGNGSMAFERALQYEVSIRDQRIRELELDNMRLMVKLEQAENDVKTATDMIMVGCRSGSKYSGQEAKPASMAVPRRVEGPRTTTNVLRGRRPTEDDHWSATRSEEDLANGTGNVYYNAGFCGAGGDAQGASRAAAHQMQEGWTGGAWPSEHELAAKEDSRVGRQVEEGSGTRKAWGWSETETSLSSRQDDLTKEARNCSDALRRVLYSSESSKDLVTAPASLLDFDDDLDKENDRVDGYRMPLPLRPLTPLGKVIGVALADPFVTNRKGKSQVIEAVSTPARTSKLPFRHLFDFDTEDSFGPGRTESSKEDTTDDYTKQKRDVLSKVTAPDLVSAIPEIEIHARRDAVRTPDPLLTALYGRKVSETIHTTTTEHKIGSGTEQAKAHDQGPEQQISSDSDPIILQYPPRDGRDNRRGRRHRSNAYDEEPARFNPNKPAPWTEHDVSYTPYETANNYLRTVMIYNLPPQVDISEIVSRAGDAPLLSIKLLPTMDMKYRNANSTISTIETMTAMMTFFLDTSAEQFVFDASIEPLVIRGRTAVVKLLNTPTYPSCLHSGAYTTAPGRLFSRRIRFHQPGLVPSDLFADVLAGNSVGYKQPGWIVDKTMKKDAGKNMITVEFASVEAAAFAFGQMMWVRDFQGCDPRMVFDHEAWASRGRRGGLKTRDNEDSGGEGVLGDKVEQQDVAGQRGSGLSSSRYADEVKSYDEPEVASFVAPPIPSFGFKLPV